ncbi:alpha/beta hydrolase [Mesorhizobium sp. LHD-90]|uniref:alpha/beta hydrolase n=1 Tax=Mesorhizobium sp. LHD-90 TaxID=3071414 RepID=UPI0027E10A05|nr:alpha/beta hydrolase [Mesorhizobium sp. LHD-90]MDQ6435005.1 alpha/beta hydrolase [Mesorhizobium sp. LHD-90]
MEKITDWDDAYANRAYINDADIIVDGWPVDAKTFRDTLSRQGRMRADIAYGPHPRNRLDLFLPEGKPLGLVVIVHGGYWMLFDSKTFSHLAKGAVERGFAVAVPSYVLCPEARISDITRQIGDAISVAAKEIGGPVHLTGHSAGGHLVSRMVSATSPLSGNLLSRLRKTVSISGVHDLRPLLNTRMVETLKLDLAESERESPALLSPLDGTKITFWVGGDERPEFVRQTQLMQDAWSGVTPDIVIEPAKHHFSVIEGLTDPNHALVRSLLAL